MKRFLGFIAFVVFIVLSWFITEVATHDSGYIKWRGKTIWSYGEQPHSDLGAQLTAQYHREDSDFTADLNAGKMDSILLSDTGYYIIKGAATAGWKAWALSNRAQYLLDSIHKQNTMKKVPVKVVESNGNTAVSGQITNPITYQDTRFRHDVGWNKALMYYNEWALSATEDGLETFRQSLEAKGLFTPEIKAIWDEQYNYLKTYQPVK
jgi:hypothetical protein